MLSGFLICMTCSSLHPRWIDPAPRLAEKKSNHVAGRSRKTGDSAIQRVLDAGLLVRWLHPQGLAFRAVCLRGRQTTRVAFRSLPILLPEVSPGFFSCRFQAEPLGKRRSKDTFLSHNRCDSPSSPIRGVFWRLCHFPRPKNCSILNIVEPTRTCLPCYEYEARRGLTGGNIAITLKTPQ